jgi:colanic acid biosynthesis glycosyl transferase WcaI
MAAGRPIIGLASEASEVAKIIRDVRCGVCAPPDDVQAIAAAIRRLAASPEERAAMGLRGRTYVEGYYGRERVIDSLETVMRRLTEK